MKRYSGYLIIGSETRSIEVIADTVHPDSVCATRFHKKVKSMSEFGSPETIFELVAQYPSDKLIIDSIEEIEEDSIYRHDQDN
jgi:hypothetical protein